MAVGQEVISPGLPRLPDHFLKDDLMSEIQGEANNQPGSSS